MARRAAIITAAAIVAVLAVGGAAFVYFVTFSPDRARYPVRGVDVSHHQGAIDWQRVAADDVDFAIIKVSEGGDHRDREFETNLKHAREAGLALGVYHFFTFCRSGAEQAANFIAAVPRDLPMLPPVVDIEYEGNCATRPSPEEFKRELDAFTAAVETAFERELLLYATGSAYLDYAAQLPDRRYWTRWIAWHPGNEDWIFWQYHDRGRVDGIVGDVDLNVLQGDRAALEALLK